MSHIQNLKETGFQRSCEVKRYADWRNQIILDTDVDLSWSNPPRSPIFQDLVGSSGTKMVVMLPFPCSIENGLNNLKFFDNGVQQTIAEYTRVYNPDSYNDPNLTNYVFCFIAETVYNVGHTYTVTWIEKRIEIDSLYYEAIPFDKEVTSPVPYAKDSDNMLLPPIDYPYVYEVWRWRIGGNGSNPASAFRQYGIGVMKEKKQGKGRYRLFCRGENGERTLKEIMQRMPFGYVHVYKVGATGYRIRPFKFAIYNTLTGARGLLTQTYGVQSTFGGYGLRRIKDK